MTVTDRCNAGLVVERGIEAAGGEKAAYVTGRESLSYEQLRRQANRMGHLLRSLGVRREQRILLVLDDTTAFPIAFLGAMRIGAVPVPLSVRESAENFRHFIEDSYAEIVVCDADLLASLRVALEGLDVHFVARGAREGAVELDAALAAQEDELSPLAMHPDDMAFWLYTSGSTGRPKGVVHRHQDMEVTCESFGRHILALGEQDVTFSSTKLYHSYGLGNSLSYPLHFGATAVLLDGSPTPDRLVSTLREQRPTVYFSVPVLYRQLLAEHDAGGALDTVRLCISAAEPLPLAIFEQWRERFGLEIVDGIGSTEMFTAYCSNVPGEVVPGTTGRPVPGYEIRLTDDHGEELEGPEAVGTMEVRGGSRAAYYWHRHDQTMKSMRGEWLLTGDRFRRREDGTYVYLGRADDMLKIGGLWVSPLDMEQVLLEHPAVEQVGVVGVSVNDYDRIAALVKRTSDLSAEAPLENELRSWCRERMREYEYPHVIRFVDELPQTLTGKPRRFMLRELVERELTASSEEGRASSPGSDTHPDDDGHGWARTLRELAEPARDEAALDLVLSEIAAVLDEGSVEPEHAHRVFEELGFDSLTGVELRSRLEAATGVSLPSTLTFDHPTPAAVASLLRARAEGEARDEPPPSGATAEPSTRDELYLSSALAAVTRPSRPPRMPPAELALRLKTSSWLRSVTPTRLAVSRAERRGQSVWEQDAGTREEALAAVETIVTGTSRAAELDELARAHVIEASIDRALFWARPWSAKVDALTALRIREAMSAHRGVLFSACHVGPYYRLQSAPPFAGRDTYTVPGAWFFEPPEHTYWGRRLARWRKGMKSRPVPAKGSFRVIQALLERGEFVFLFFDMPGPRRSRFLGKPAELAEGTAQLAVRADALVLPLRARRAGHRVWVDAAAPLDPRELAGVDQLHDALIAVHERWILERPAAMEDPRTFGWKHGATPEGWVQP
jgi:benzoate-CoA ligase family protein